jgi:hypothetical protein
MRRILASIFVLATFLMVTANGIMAQTGAAGLSELPAKRLLTSYTRYNRWRFGSDSLPIEVVNVSGGKLGPTEKFKILVTRLSNRLPKAVTAVKFNWYLFTIKDLDKVVETEQTSLVDVSLAPHEKRDLNIFIVNVEDIPILGDMNLDEQFQLEVAVTEIHYEDGTVWEAKDLPAKMDRSKIQ